MIPETDIKLQDKVRRFGKPTNRLRFNYDGKLLQLYELEEYDSPKFFAWVIVEGQDNEAQSKS